MRARARSVTLSRRARAALLRPAPASRRYGSGTFAALGFAEEILPGLDFVPTATIAWFLTQSDAGTRLDASVNRDAGAPKRPPPPADDQFDRDGAIDV